MGRNSSRRGLIMLHIDECDGDGGPRIILEEGMNRYLRRWTRLGSGAPRS